MPLALKVKIEYKLVDDPGEECYLSCSLCLGLVQSVQYAVILFFPYSTLSIFKNCYFPPPEKKIK